MAKAGYSVVTSAVVALSAGVARSVLGIKSGAAFGLDLTYAEVSFDGVTASAAITRIWAYCAAFCPESPIGSGCISVMEISYALVGAVWETMAYCGSTTG